MIRAPKRNPSLWQISAITSPVAEDAVAGVFEEIFRRPPAVYVDADTNAVRISVYCETADRGALRQRTALHAGLLRLREHGLDPGNARIQVRQIRREDWAESWKRHFKPLEVGHNLLIKPSWSRRNARRNQALVVLDPGLSFGTGQHPTTLFCLEQLVQHRRKDKSQALLDIGTGSGILAISAAAVGYSPVKAFDFDPVAVRISKANALANRRAARVQIACLDINRLPLRSGERFDVICANLTVDLLVMQRRRILNRLAPQGVLVLAGILRTQFHEVRNAFEAAGMRMIASQFGGEWRSGAFRRR